MEHVFRWADAHPVLMAMVIWPFVFAVLTYALKPRTPEEYAAMHPRVAATLKLIAALGIDPIKAMQAMKEVVEKRERRP